MHSLITDSSVPSLIELELDAAAFSADWGHCDRTANYLARLASFDRRDAFLYGNLLSTVLNELFEIVFCEHQTPGIVRCTLLRNGIADRIVLEIPVRDAQRAFYEQGVARSQAPEAADTYTRTMFGEATPDRSIGFLELAADYGAKIELAGATSDILQLIVEVRLEDGPLSHPSAATPATSV